MDSISDAAGKRRREKAGTRATRTSAFSAVRRTRSSKETAARGRQEDRRSLQPDLAKDALTHAKSENYPVHVHELELKFNTLLPAFGKRVAETITRQELVAWLDLHERRRDWKPANATTYGRLPSPCFSVSESETEKSIGPDGWCPAEAGGQRPMPLPPLDDEIALTTLLQKKLAGLLADVHPVDRHRHAQERTTALVGDDSIGQTSR